MKNARSKLEVLLESYRSCRLIGYKVALTKESKLLSIEESSPAQPQHKQGSENIISEASF